MPQCANFLTTVPYIERSDIYERERLYSVDFAVDHIDGAKQTNFIHDPQQIEVQDVRTIERPFELDVNGFCFISVPTSLTAAQALSNATKYEKEYFAELRSLLLERFPRYKEIEFLDMVVRKRDPRFPDVKGMRVTHEQPAGVPHIDFSRNGISSHIDHLARVEEREFLTKYTDYDQLNVWRPLVGPNDDWPLVFCDAQTVDADRDASLHDAVHDNYVGENWLLQHNQAHRWYYMSAQQPENLIVFRNADFRDEKPCAFHVAVANPLSDPKAQLRESVEVRLLAYC